jgi:hypothetical protein
MTTAVAELEQLRLVINHGKTDLESATVAVQWFLSEELIEIKPKYIILVEHTEADIKSGDMNYCGRRYIVPVADVMTYIAFRAPGVCRVSAYISMSLDDREGFRKNMLKQKSRYR